MNVLVHNIKIGITVAGNQLFIRPCATAVGLVGKFSIEPTTLKPLPARLFLDVGTPLSYKLLQGGGGRPALRVC